jgi:hypothetical protein
MSLKIAAAVVSMLALALSEIVIARGLPFTRNRHLIHSIISLLIANTMIWLSQRSDWSAQTRAQLLVAGWIWLLVQLGCSIYLFHSFV